jgi:nitrite reductase/ring-hydroxylating ferredoxin subunit
MGRRVWVARLSEIQPGRGKLVQAEGRAIALFAIEGSVRAISAICPHRGGPLEEGDVEGETVYCPWHAYDFNLRTGECREAPDLAVQTFTVSVESNEVFVQLPESNL